MLMNLKRIQSFYAPEKAQYNKKTMNMIKLEDSVVTSDAQQILQEQNKFYTQLYKCDSDINFRYVNKDNVNQLDRYKSRELDQNFGYEEITKAVKELKPDKCCGNDGVTAELIQFFWSKLGTIYYKAILYTKNVGHLHLAA